MTDVWQKLDQEVAATPMPEFYQKKMVSAMLPTRKLAGWNLKKRSCASLVAGMDTVQRLRGNVERALPRPGAKVSWLQLLQHQGDEGRLGYSRVLQSLTLTANTRI